MPRQVEAPRRARARVRGPGGRRVEPLVSSSQAATDAGVSRVAFNRSLRTPEGAEARHLGAVAGSLRFASESAARGDHRDALGWLNVLEAVGEVLPAEYVAKRGAWLAAALGGQVGVPLIGPGDEAG